MKTRLSSASLLVYSSAILGACAVDAQKSPTPAASTPSAPSGAAGAAAATAPAVTTTPSAGTVAPAPAPATGGTPGGAATDSGAAVDCTAALKDYSGSCALYIKKVVETRNNLCANSDAQAKATLTQMLPAASKCCKQSWSAQTLLSCTTPPEILKGDSKDCICCRPNASDPKVPAWTGTCDDGLTQFKADLKQVCEGPPEKPGNPGPTFSYIVRGEAYNLYYCCGSLRNVDGAMDCQNQSQLP